MPSDLHGGGDLTAIDVPDIRHDGGLFDLFGSGDQSYDWCLLEEGPP